MAMRATRGWAAPPAALPRDYLTSVTGGSITRSSTSSAAGPESDGALESTR